MNRETKSIRPMSSNPLLASVERAENRVHRLKSDVRKFYYQVVLSQYRCPVCGADLHMHGPGRSICADGHVVDPTVAFQRSPCCEAPLSKKMCHYACSRCGRGAVSKFLFDERIFDNAYFSEMMRQSRVQKRRRIAELKELLMNTRSGPLSVDSLPELGDIPGLIEALDSLSRVFVPAEQFMEDDAFDMNTYRRVVLECLGGTSAMFSTLPAVSENLRKDRVRRFVTLVFMEHEREVALTQHGDDILVEKHEADVEG